MRVPHLYIVVLTASAPAAVAPCLYTELRASVVVCNTPGAVARISSVYRHGDVNNLPMASLVLVYRVSELVYITGRWYLTYFSSSPAPMISRPKL